MFRVKKYLFLFLCFSILKFELCESNELIDFIQSNASVANIDENYTREVTLFKVFKYNVLINIIQTNDNEEQAVDKLIAFYLVLGCNFAEWTIMQINDFIRSFPLFYQHTFLNTEYGKVFIDNYDDYIKTLNTIDDYITKFIYTLQNILNVNSNVFNYNELTILKSFKSLKIKISSIMSPTTLLDFNNSDLIIIQEMLKELNFTQSFLIMNCDNLPLNNNNNSQLYGYLSTVNNANSTDFILESIKSSFDWKSDIQNCSMKQIFLENIITIHSTEPISNDILNAKIKTVRWKSITVRDILEKISQSHDIERIYWCEKSILTTIVKVIYCKVFFLLSEKSSLSQIMYIITEINSKISKNKANLPTYFSKGLKYLELVKDRDTFRADIDYDAMVLKIKTYYDSIDSVELKCPVDIADEGEIKLKDDNFMDQSTKELFITNTLDSLDNLMKKISKHFDDFVCFYKYFECLQDEFDKTTFPLEKIETKLQSVEKNTESETLCRFVFDLYLICYKTLIFLNRGVEKGNKNEYTEFFTKAWNSIRDIKNYFLKIIKIGTEHFDLIEIAYNIVIVLENANEPIDTIRGKYLKRIMYFVMAELNNYGFQHCTLPKFNFFLFSNLNFNTVMDDDVKNVIKNGDKTYYDFNTVTVEPQDYKCFSYKYVNQILIDKSDFIIPYENIIHFYWKGKKQSILEVFKEITHLNPLYLYLLYDTYFMFHLAVIYCEVKREYNFLANKQPSTEIYDSNEVIGWHQNFPKRFATMIDDIYYINTILKTRSELDKSKYSSKSLQIEKQFKQYNFVFDFSYIQNGITVNTGEKDESLQDEYLKFRTNSKIFTKNVSTNVNKLYTCYVKVTPQKPTKYKRVQFSPAPAPAPALEPALEPAPAEQTTTISNTKRKQGHTNSKRNLFKNIFTKSQK